jgi:hypothetical protein
MVRLERCFAASAVGCLLLALGAPGFAQITNENGAAQQENRASTMGTVPGAASSAVHESDAPQSKEAKDMMTKKGKTEGKTGGENKKASGAGGFDNGLYGTGAGSNK